VLEDVVRGHLRSDRPIGVMLSGGLDSGAIAATLARLAPARKIYGFTVVPDTGEDSESERPYVEKLAARYPNLEIVVVAKKSLTPLDPYWRESFSAIGLPLASMPLAARRLALSAAAAERGVGTLLVGDTGNLTFTRDGAEAFADLARAGRWLQLAKEIRLAAKSGDAGAAAIFRRWVLRELVPEPALTAIEKWRGRLQPAVRRESYIRDDFAASIGFAQRLARQGYNPTSQSIMHEGHRIAAFLEHLQSPWAEAFSLHNQRLGIETGAPLRDRRMVDFSLSVPSTQYLRNGVRRWLARRALADRLPPEIVERTFNYVPFPDLLQWTGSWREAALENLEVLEQSETVRRCIDIPRIRKTLSEPLPASQLGDRRLEYTLFMPDALHVGDFIRWTEGANR
jgi:asparagine synthase (glutamine-hydrolysing)